MANGDANTHAKKWVVAGGIFNCVLAFPLAFPFLHVWYIELLNTLNSTLNLYGKEWVPPTDGANMLFLNTAGLALLLVGMLLLFASRDLENRIVIPFLNGIVRCIWAVVAIYYIFVYELLEVLYFVVFADILFSSVYCFYYFKNRVRN